MSGDGTRKPTKRLPRASQSPRARESARPGRKSAAPPKSREPVRRETFRERRAVRLETASNIEEEVVVRRPAAAIVEVGGSTGTLEAMRARITDLETALAAEKAERDAEALMMGEMLARHAAAEAESKAARSDVDAADARARVAETRARELEDHARMLADRVRELEANALRLRSVRPPPPSAPGGPSTLRNDGATSAQVLEKRLFALEELCADAAALFEELERREEAIAEMRSAALAQARGALLRSIGREPAPRPKPPPIPTAPSRGQRADAAGAAVDVSDLAEMYESLPPTPSSSSVVTSAPNDDEE